MRAFNAVGSMLTLLLSEAALPPSPPPPPICSCMMAWSIGPPGTKRVMAKTSIVIPMKVGIRSKKRRAK